MILLITDVFYYCKCIYILDTFFMLYFCYFFFFKQKTEYDMRISDWSSYVCSSDLSDARVHEHAVHAELHRDRRVRRGPDAGVHDDRDLDRLAQEADLVWVLDAEARADRRPERHDRRAAEIPEALGDHD